MNIAIVIRGYIEFDGKYYYIKDVFGKFIQDFSPYFNKIILCAIVYPKKPDEESFSHYRLLLNNVIVLSFPGYKKENPGILNKTWHYFRYGKNVFRYIKEWDLLYLYMPSYLSSLVYLINKIYARKFYFVYVGSDWGEISRYHWRWDGKFRKFFFPIFRTINRWLEHIVVKRSPFVIVHGKDLMKKYLNKVKGKLVETHPEINLSIKEFYKRDDTCTGEVVRCLYVGSIIPRKGLEYLIKSLPLIDKRIVLWIVGEAQKEYKNYLNKLINNLQIKDRIKFKGYVLNGPSLWEIYRVCDIFVLPTLSEGFPRVLYEAMSQSLPIITTDVNGIGEIMLNEKDVLLVHPRSETDIANAIMRIREDSKLRRYLIKNSLETVNAIVKFDQANQINNLLKNYFPQYKKRIDNYEKEIDYY